MPRPIEPQLPLMLPLLVHLAPSCCSCEHQLRRTTSRPCAQPKQQHGESALHFPKRSRTQLPIEAVGTCTTDRPLGACEWIGRLSPADSTQIDGWIAQKQLECLCLPLLLPVDATKCYHPTSEVPKQWHSLDGVHEAGKLLLGTQTPPSLCSSGSAIEN